MRRASILTAAAVVLAVGAQSRGNILPVNSNSKVEYGIEYYIETDKAVYDLGEDLGLLFRMTNLTDKEWELRWGGPGRDIVVEADGEAGALWAWSWWIVVDTGPRSIRLQPGESWEIVDVWPQLDYGGIPDPEGGVPAAPGTYTVTGSFEPMEVSVSVNITIVPEPATIVLLCGGVLFVKKRPFRARL
jgi:hypothetical protein